ncbi:MAG: hypothetical protein JXA33_04455 [Anaerolineae bacterium]|nr:hypothetical protein [Anaerolineae bacterium]
MRYRWIVILAVLMITLACSLENLNPPTVDIKETPDKLVTPVVDTEEMIAVVVQNASSYDICSVYISVVEAEAWGDDLLASETVIAPEDTRSFEVPIGQYDVLVVDCEGAVMMTAWQIDTDVTLTIGRAGTIAFRLLNNSVKDICYVYISPPNMKNWGEDYLEQYEIVFARGGKRLFFVAPGQYDLLAVDCSDKQIVSEYGIEVTEGMMWTIAGDLSAKYSEDFLVTVENLSPYPICFVMISPADAADWGRDWLNVEESIDLGETRSFDVSAGSYDVLLQDCEGFVLASAWDVTGSIMLRPGEQGGVPLKITNESSKDVCYLHIMPTAKDDWGDDWLGGWEVILAREGQRTFFVSPGVYDLAARDCDGDMMTVEREVMIEEELSWRLVD